jgi:hypothetical protein
MISFMTAMAALLPSIGRASKICLLQIHCVGLSQMHKLRSTKDCNARIRGRGRGGGGGGRRKGEQEGGGGGRKRRRGGGREDDYHKYLFKLCTKVHVERILVLAYLPVLWQKYLNT